MRGLVYTTAALIALGLGTAAPGHAQGYPSKASRTSTPTTATSQQPTATQAGKETLAMHMTRSSSAMKTARMHRSPTQIRQIQERLKAAGLYKGRIDGKFGRQTQLALQRFERSHRGGTLGIQGSSMPKRHAVKMTPRSTQAPSQAGSSLPQPKPQTTTPGGGSGSSQPPQKTGGNAGSDAGGMQQNQQK